MAKLITIPNFKDITDPILSSNTIEEIIWHKKVNDNIKVGDIICSIETEKSTLEFESVYEGYLLIKNTNTQLSFMDFLCVIGKKNEGHIEILKEHEKSINKKMEQVVFTIKNTFEPYYDGHKNVKKNPFIWLKNFFK